MFHLSLQDLVFWSLSSLLVGLGIGWILMSHTLEPLLVIAVGAFSLVRLVAKLREQHAHHDGE